MSMLKVWWTTSRTSERGFSAVEALLAATVFATLVTGLIGAIIYGRGSTADAGIHNRATMLAEEGIEAARNIGNASYSNLVNGTYGIAQSAGVWAFSGASDTSDIYTRQVTVADSGTNRKQITSVVSWTLTNGTTSSVTLRSMATNWEATIVPPTSWTNGILAGSVDLSGTVDALKVATSGDYAYVVRGSGTNNFTVVNISNPAAPSVVGNLNLAGTPANIAISGNYAYIANGGDTTEFQVVNISNPASPTLAATLDLAGTANATGVYVSGNTAYVTRAASTTTNSNELAFITITTPTAPVVNGGYNNNSITMSEAYVSGNYAYVATTSTSAEMIIVNVSNLASPTLTATYNPAGLVGASTIEGIGTTMIIGYGAYFDIVNVATPASPSRLGVYFTSTSNITDIDVDSSNQYAFIGSSYMFGEFQILNISNLASPTLTKLFDLTGSPGTVNGVAYNASLDVVVGASIIDTQEVLVFKKN